MTRKKTKPGNMLPASCWQESNLPAGRQQHPPVRSSAFRRFGRATAADRLKAELQTLLGIECGGTRTVALLVRGSDVTRLEAGPANLRLVTDAQLIRHFRALRDRLPAPVHPNAIGIGMAGARTATLQKRILHAAETVWPGVPCRATNDLETALATATTGERTNKILILSGTGSCCFGRAANGRTFQFGGWGHLLGDKGSGYEIGLRALKAVVYYLDRDGEWSLLGRRILRTLQLNEPNELIGWAQAANKTDIAALAVEVFEAARDRDKIARDILEGAAHSLAKDAAHCARRLVKPGTLVQFILAGSVLLRQPRFARKVAAHLKKLWPNSTIAPLKRESAWGAVELAKACVLNSTFNIQHSTLNVSRASDALSSDLGQNSPTEQRNPRSMNLDKLSINAAIALMLREDEKIPAAILGEGKKIEDAVTMIVRSFKSGGRLFYAGAGTSGRLGVLDASECPPTFRTPPEMVQGIIAGGQTALWRAVEGAEDDPAAGARAVEFRGVQRGDVLVGIAASGRTPFVWGALAEASRRGAKTILLCFNPNLKIPRDRRPSLVIAPAIGPEILTGSTRLKAGTATKLILNIFTTLAMTRLGKVSSNLMIDVKPSNAKLRERAVRIVSELTGADAEHARATLEKSDWVVKTALDRVSRKLGVEINSDTVKLAP